MTPLHRRLFTRVPALLATLAFGSLLAACSSGSATGAVGTSGQSEPFVSIDTASVPFVVVENRTGQALIDVDVALKNGMLTFSDTISRLEANEKRQIRHNDFASRDGTSFSLRITKPRSVAVTARDLNGKRFEMTVPWQ